MTTDEMQILFYLRRDGTVSPCYFAAEPKYVARGKTHSAWRMAHFRNALRCALSALRKNRVSPL